MYAGQEATVRTGHGTTDWFQIGKGVRQGYILYVKAVYYLTYRQSNHEKHWAGRNTSWNQDCRENINNLRYAYDTTLMAKQRRTKEPLDASEREE